MSSLLDREAYALWIALLLDSAKSTYSEHVCRAEVVARLFQWVNRVKLGDSAYTRFTWFNLAPFDDSVLIATSRWRRGVTDVVREADKSRAYFREGKGLAGWAWAHPNDEVHFQIYPRCSNRPELEDYYVQELKLSRKAAERVSDRMLAASATFCYAYEGEGAKILGVLSLDIMDADVSKKSRPLKGDVLTVRPRGRDTDSNGHFIVDSTALSQTVIVVGKALEGFRAARPRERN